MSWKHVPTPKVHAIIYEPGVKPPSLPAAVLVKFDQYTGPSYLSDVDKIVPICPIRREWHSQSKHHSRTMLPIMLGYSLSIHKLQGETVEKVILNLGPVEFATGLTLVGASRVRKYEDLAFSPYPNFERFQQIANSKGLKQRIYEDNRLKQLSVATLSKYADVIAAMREELQHREE